MMLQRWYHQWRAAEAREKLAHLEPICATLGRLAAKEAFCRGSHFREVAQRETAKARKLQGALQYHEDRS